jgi:hypothetical protein
VPLPPQSAIPAEVCCDTLWRVAEDILHTAHDAVAGCLPEPLCDQLAHFISVAEPTHPPGDYVSVWLQAVDPAPGTVTRAGRVNLMPRPRGVFGVKLIETGWPMIASTDGGFTLPEPEVMHMLAKHSYAHAELMMRAVYNSFRERTSPGRSCGFLATGALEPTQREVGRLGWRFTLTLDIDL